MDTRNEGEVDFGCLSAELVFAVFAFVDAPTLRTCAAVCRTWHSFANDDHLWRGLVARPSANRVYGWQLAAPDGKWKPLYYALAELDREWRAPALRPNLLIDGVRASSTDHARQGIRETLKLEQEHCFWSSTGTADPDTDEFLVYRLRQAVSVVFSVTVKPYRAHYQQGQPAYHPRSVRISVGFSPDEFHYVGPTIAYPPDATSVSVELGPELVVGGFVRIDLLGRTQTQPADELFYTCVECTLGRGVPAGALGNSVLRDAVVAFAVERAEFAQHAPSTLSDAPELALRLASEIKHDLVSMQMASAALQRARELLAANRGIEAAQVVSDRKLKGVLRTSQTLELFQQRGWLFQYFTVLLRQQTTLTKAETLLLVELLFKRSNPMAHLMAWFRSGLLCLSQELGDMLRPHDLVLAAQVYLSSAVADKVIECLYELKNYARLIDFARRQKFKMNYAKLLADTHAASVLEGLKFGAALVNAGHDPAIDLELVCKILGIRRGEHEFDLRKLITDALNAECKKLGVSDQPPPTVGGLDDDETDDDDDFEDEEDEEDAEQEEEEEAEHAEADDDDAADALGYADEATGGDGNDLD
eukprot:TRINITY_DN10891_c0_g1_i2.p1 TRINITY_DN10891_c0_g1~~TRINITY_DN10891_c0_g1_i2.p1  ORF type:complete len:589 (-),score=265.30 TRINITY_DN10891_c0_g1_i2:226-1992(-)